MTRGSTRPTRHELLAARRGCAVCGTRLSAYNDGQHCWTHTLEIPWKGPNHKPR